MLYVILILQDDNSNALKSQYKHKLPECSNCNTQWIHTTSVIPYNMLIIMTLSTLCCWEGVMWLNPDQVCCSVKSPFLSVRMIILVNWRGNSCINGWPLQLIRPVDHVCQKLTNPLKLCSHLSRSKTMHLSPLC